MQNHQPVQQRDPELAARFPLKLKWRQTEGMLLGEHFSADDPETGEPALYIFAHKDGARKIVGWKWICNAPNIRNHDVVELIPVREGVASSQREAAWDAEQLYKLYLEITREPAPSPYMHNAYALMSGRLG